MNQPDMLDIAESNIVDRIFPPHLYPALQNEYLGNTLAQYLLAFLIFVGIWAVIILFRSIILGKLRRAADATRTQYDNRFVELIASVSQFFYIFLSVYLTVKTLNLSDRVTDVFDGVFVVLLVFETAKVFQLLVEIIFTSTSSSRDQTMLHALRLITAIVVWAVGLLLILANFGFDITALAASLGIGGIAIALAAQNILSDLFSSFSIYFDKPFRIGDFIIIGNDMGTVKKIGLKTTRIEALRGEELVVSNQELTSTRIMNFKRMKKRRIVFTIGVEYSTPTKKLEQIPGMIKDIIEPMEQVDFDRAHFFQFGDFALIYEVVYYVDSSDYNQYMDIQQDINFGIRKAFEKAKIEMAFPTQTLHLIQEKTAAK